MLHHQRDFVVVRRSQVHRVFVAARVAQARSTRERRKKRNLFLLHQGHRRHAGRCTDVTEEGKHAVVNQRAGVGRAAVGFIAVIQFFDFNRLAAKTALGVVLVEPNLRTLVELNP